MANSESFIMEVIAQARAEGADTTTAALHSLQSQVDQLARHVGMAEKDLRTLSSAFERVSSSAASATSSVSKQDPQWIALEKRVQGITDSLQKYARAAAAAGDTNPFQTALKQANLSQDDLDAINSLNDARGASATRAAQQVTSAESQIQDAYRRSASLAEERRNSELDATQVLEDRVATLKRLEAAQIQATLKASRGSDTVSEAAEQQKLVKIQEDLFSAEKKLSSLRETQAREWAAAESRLEKIQVDRAKADAAESNKTHDAKMANVQKEIDAAKRLAAAQEEAARTAANRVSRTAQGENYSRARGYATARPGSLFDQGQIYDTSKALKASETSWAKQAQAVDLATGAVQRHEQHLPRLRYALHDVSNQLLVIGGTMTAFSVLSFKAAIDYERSFANVIRTNDSLMNSQVAANRMFQEFIDLAGEIPTSFGDLSEIGQLAGQLDVPTHALREFTESVAMFSATTGESIDTTATAFGRLDALLPGVQGNFQALGSSILNVGINSVATEGEIIKITTQLAGIGSQAGLTYDELVGLSGALASVGIQPELSRGTITRLFGQISRSVTLGGESLQEFAKISGQSADQFANQWASEPMEAVVNVLRGLNARGGEAEAALRAVGITSVRDVPAILRLAQTVDTILVPALGDAAAGADEATQLADNYGIIAETVASKLQILANNFQSLVATMGGATGPMATLLDLANGFLTWARGLLDNPVTGFFAQMAVVVTALSGVMAVLLAGVTRAAAGILAFRTAMAESGVAATGLRAQLTGLIGTIAGVDAASVKASGNMGRLTTVMRGAGAAAVAMIAIPVVGWLDDVAQKAQGAVVDVDTLSTALSKLDVGVSSGVSEDISQVINKSLESLGAATQGRSVWESIFPPMGLENAIRRGMVEGEAEYDAGLQRLTMKTSSWITSNPWNNGEATWYAGFLDPTIAQIEKFEEAWIQAWESASSETQKEALLNALAEMQEGMSSEEVEAFKYNLSDLFDVIGSGVDETALLAEQTQLANDEFEAMQDTLLQIVDDVFSAVNAQYALSDSLMDLGSDYINLGAAAAFSGDSMQSTIKTIVEQSGSAGAAAANLQVLYDFILANSSATAGELIYLANAIKLLTAEAGGRTASATLQLPDFNSFAQGADRARASLTRVRSAGRSAGRETARAAKEAQKEVRTLTDYADDLAKVWSRAFDIRFSGQSTRDAVTSTIISLREAAENAARSIRDLRTEIQKMQGDIQGLQSDIQIQEYFLGIALEYGDTQRATAIEAELAKLRADLASQTESLADKQKELSDQQAAASTTLVGNSKAAVENRKSIQGLVQQYQAHIQALAASGMSQEDLARATAALRQDFIQQATQLGYNRGELELYALAFDDVSYAIANVPRDVTVEVRGKNAAVAALEEIRAKAQEAANAVGGIGGGGGAGGGVGGGGASLPGGVGGASLPGGHKSIRQLLNQDGLNQGALAPEVKPTLNLSDLLNPKNWSTLGTVATVAGMNSSQAFVESLKSLTDKGVPAALAAAILGANPSVLKNATTVGEGAGTEISGVASSTSRLGMIQGIPAAILGAATMANRAGEGVGRDSATSLNSGAGLVATRGYGLGIVGGINSGSRTVTDRGWSLGTSAGDSLNRGSKSAVTNGFGTAQAEAMRSGDWSIRSQASSIGRTVGNLIGDGISFGLDLIFGSGTRTRRNVRNILGFESGGYTGRGASSQVAGLVHAGEYVIPKSGVNQATGLPTADALGRLMNGVISTGRPPATQSSGAGQVATVALTAGTIQAIAQATGKTIYLNGKVIADSSAQSYTQDYNVGAY